MNKPPVDGDDDPANPSVEINEPAKPSTEMDAPPNLADLVDPDSAVYLAAIGTSGTVGAVLGGPPGALIGAGIGVAVSAIHYVAGRPKRSD
jgi:hypothetical protein